MLKIQKSFKNSCVGMAVTAAVVLGFSGGVAHAETLPVEPVTTTSAVATTPVAADKFTIFVVSSGLGTQYTVTRGSNVAGAMKEAGVPLGELDQLSVPADSLVTDMQFITVVRMRLDAVDKPVVDKHASITQDSTVNCSGSWDTLRVVKAGVDGERVESWARVIVDTKVQSEMKVSEIVKKTKVDEVVAECAPQPAPQPTIVEPVEDSKDSTVVDDTVAEIKDVVSDSTTPASSVKKPSSTVSGSKQDWMKAAGIAESDWSYVDYIVNRESSWNPNAVNKSSGACGLVQALPCSKLGSNWNDPVTALKWQKNYVTERYGNYTNAYSFWKTNSWY